MSMEFLYLKNQLKLFYFARRDQSDMRNMKLNTATQFSGHYAKKNGLQKSTDQSEAGIPETYTDSIF